MALTLLELRVGGLEKRPCHPEGRVLHSADRGERGQIRCTSPARALIPRPRYWETPRSGDVRENTILTLHLKTCNGGLTERHGGKAASVRAELRKVRAACVHYNGGFSVRGHPRYCEVLKRSSHEDHKSALGPFSTRFGGLPSESPLRQADFSLYTLHTGIILSCLGKPEK
jgi:hypothetical protein